MWKARREKKAASDARIPEGSRLYAIGDVHGRADLLEQVFSKIDADRAERPGSNVTQLLIGDYIDRGLRSREVLDRLIARGQTENLVCLKGNHETFIPDFLTKPSVFEDWRRLGGMETLLSYGVLNSISRDALDPARLSAALAEALPASHRAFLNGLRSHYEYGDFFFAHAGVRPRVALAKQQEQDLLWIRDDFLLHEDSYTKVIVHGHTPVREPDIRANRINIDTGAYATGRLTCMVIEGNELFFL